MVHSGMSTRIGRNFAKCSGFLHNIWPNWVILHTFTLPTSFFLVVRVALKPAWGLTCTLSTEHRWVDLTYPPSYHLGPTKPAKSHLTRQAPCTPQCPTSPLQVPRRSNKAHLAHLACLREPLRPTKSHLAHLHLVPPSPNRPHPINMFKLSST